MAPSASGGKAPRGPRRRRFSWLPGALFSIVAVIAAVAFALLLARSEESTYRAVIVDQLALTEPNAGFVANVTGMLEGSGYEVDYVPGEEVTVDFYRELPSRGYELLVLRVHTARFEAESLTMPDPAKKQELLQTFGEDVFLFTSEPYDQSKYAQERERRQLFAVRYRQGGDQRYFGVTPHFVQSAMKGDFGGATIVLMGCDGLLFDNTPRTLVERGAKAVIGWDGLVSGAHTDAATEALLRHLLEGATIGQAAQKTMSEVGREPGYENSLRVYPQDAAIETIR